ncbi:MAG: iron-sulfur cluster-binding protein [Verrucomicrobia bacterium]|nr:iron-sulfur cluster-binding protein [Verrucomicrobiota bacterium]
MTHACQFIRDSATKAADLRHRAVLQKATGTYATKVQDTKSLFIDWSYGRELARQRKWEAVNDLAFHLEEFDLRATARGMTVHWAENAAEAREIILGLCKRHGVRKVVKSKSMVTEEIHLNDFLEENGVIPVESDLGEYIVQLRHEHPYHIVTPVMHLTKEDIDLTFHEKLGTPTGSTAEDLTLTARRVLRNEYLTADMGITGANFIIAETGMVCLTENEGNARLSSSMPRVHLAICGIEKVLPRLDDLALFLPMLAVSGTGQQLTCYNTMIGGPRQTTEVDGPDEVHVILLDNGRTELLADAEQREALHCIRCGACLNACPVFKNIGGHAYGTTYQGPIGSVITPHLRGLEEWKHLSYASSLCGGCAEVCPVHIELHHHLLRNRRNAVQTNGSGWLEQISFQLWSFAMRNTTIYRVCALLSRFGQGISRRLGIEGTALDPLQRWSKTRALPEIPARSFHDWWHERNQ